MSETAVGLALEVIDDEPGLAALRDEWERLERLDPECTPFNTWLWNSLWWRHYAATGARSRRLRVLALRARNRDGATGRAVALLPLQVSRERRLGVLRADTLRFLGSGGDTSPDYLNLVAEPASRARAERRLLDAVFAMDDWQHLHLSDVASPSSLETALDERLAHERGVRLGGRVNSIRVATLPSSWEDYRLALSRKRRKQINHRRNRLERAGRCELGIAATPAELAEAREALVELHRARWRSKGERGAFVSREYVDFHRAVIEGFFARDALWLATLRLDGRIIGVQYVFRWRDALLFFQSGYSPAHEGLSPGHVLFTHVIGEGIARGLRRVDMLKGDYDYKRVYARRTRRTRDISYLRPGALATLVALRDRLRRLRGSAT